MTAQVVKASLLLDGDSHNVLRFNIDGIERDLDLDDETNEDQIKNLFDALLTQMVEGEIQVVSDIPEDRVHDLYGEVCTAYITQLNTELGRVQSKMKSYGLSRFEDKGCVSATDKEQA